jgi:hypothetical protein
MRSARDGVAATLAALLLGCATPTGLAAMSEIEFDGPDGYDLLVFQPWSRGMILQDGVGTIMGSYRVDENVLQIEDARGRVSAHVQPSADGGQLEVRASKDNALIFRIYREPDGDVRIEDPESRVVFKFKKRDYGYKVVDKQESSLGRVRAKREKTSLRDDDGNTVMSTRDPIPPEAAGCLLLSELPYSVRGGLAVAMIQWRLDGP